MNFLRAATAASLVLSALLPGRVLSQQLSAGNLVVLRVGDGVAALSNAAQPVFLDEYTTTGVLVQSLPLPTAASGLNQPLTNSGTATSEGHLNLTSDGRYLIASGYGAVPGTPGIAATSSATVSRVIGRIGLNGAVDTSTALNNAFSGNNIRSAASDNGLQFWAAGANGGIQYATLGATTALAINAVNPLNNRVLNIFAGQLYTASATGTFQGVSAVGTGLPTTAGQTITLLPGFPTVSGPSNYDFFFADANTVYVADDRNTGPGGIQKWTQSGGTWTLQYTLAPATNLGCRSLIGSVSGGVTTLYATTTQNALNTVVAVTDTGAASPFTVLATAAVNTVLRGIRLVPVFGDISRVAHGCGVATIATTGQPRVGGSVTTTLGGLTGAPLIALGFTIVNIPFCTCTLGHDYRIIVVGGTTGAIPIPNDPLLIGAQVGFQGVDVLATGGCASPPLALTDTMVVTIG